MSLPAPPHRRWFQVGLRGLMVAVLVVGGIAGWMAHVIRTQREAIATIRAAGGVVYFDWQKQRVEAIGPDGTARQVPRREPDAPAILRRWLGDELFQEVDAVYFHSPVTPELFATLDHFRKLETLGIDQTKPIAVDLSHLRRLRSLQNFTLYAPAVDDAVLGQVARLDSLRSFQVMRAKPIQDSPGTDAGFGQLARLPNLETLHLIDCSLLTDAGVARMVTGLPRLQLFHLSAPLASVAATIPTLIAHHPDLRGLMLSRAGVRDDDLRHLAELTWLEDLSLGKMPITDAGLAYLRPLTLLRSLRLEDVAMSDAGLTHLAGFTRLKFLTLNWTAVTDAGLPSLKPFVNLKSLMLIGTRVTDAGMSTLARLPSLEDLRLSDLPLTDQGVLALAPLPKLRLLDLNGTQVTAAGRAALRRAAPQVRFAGPDPTATAATTTTATPKAARTPSGN